MAFKIIHEAGKYLDCTPMHGKWCDIVLMGNDVGYAQVGIISSGKSHILFQYRDKRGIVPKAYIKMLEEVRMTPWKMRKQQELITEEWDDSVNPFERFLGKKCNIHMHQTRLFEANAGFFAAEVDFVGENIIRIQGGNQQYNIKQNMICGIMEC